MCHTAVSNELKCQTNNWKVSPVQVGFKERQLAIFIKTEKPGEILELQHTLIKMQRLQGHIFVSAILIPN